MTDRSFCVGCDRFGTCSIEPLSRHCTLKFKMKTQRPQTNADRIRAMSDEELAEFIGGIYTLDRDAWGDYDPCVVVEGVKIRDTDDMLDWLQLPAGGGGDV